MKHTFVFFSILLIFACKKYDTRPDGNDIDSTGKPKPVTPCPQGYYGANCDSAFLDLLEGVYEVYDSCVLKHNGNPTYIINTHVSSLVDSFTYVVPCSGCQKDSIRTWFINNFWGYGETEAVLYKSADSIYTFRFPYYKGSTIVRHTDKSYDYPYFIKSGNSWVYQKHVLLKENGLNEDNYFYIRLTRLP